MPSVKIALVAGLTLLVAGILATLARSPMTVARSNISSHDGEAIALSSAGASYCQGGEAMPPRTLAIRVALRASVGPRVALTVTSGGDLIAAGEQRPGWNGAAVSVPVRPLPRAVHAATVCVSFQARNELLTLSGQAIPGVAASYDDQGALPGSMRLEYLHAGTRSWAALIPSIVAHMALGRAFEGTAIVYLAFALLGAIAIGVSALLLKELS